MSVWSCPQAGEIVCADDAVRMPVGSVLQRVADDNGKRYRVISTPAAAQLAALRAVADAARATLDITDLPDAFQKREALRTALAALDGDQ